MRYLQLRIGRAKRKKQSKSANYFSDEIKMEENKKIPSKNLNTRVPFRWKFFTLGMTFLLAYMQV